MMTLKVRKHQTTDFVIANSAVKCTLIVNPVNLVFRNARLIEEDSQIQNDIEITKK